MCLMFTCVLWRKVASSHISIRTFRRALTASVDSCAEIKSAPSVALLNLAEFGGRSRKAMLGVCSCSKLQALVYKSRGNFFSFLFFSFFFLPGVDASHVYVRAVAQGCFYSQYPNLSEGADLSCCIARIHVIRSRPEVNHCGTLRASLSDTFLSGDFVQHFLLKH